MDPAIANKFYRRKWSGTWIAEGYALAVHHRTTPRLRRLRLVSVDRLTRNPTRWLEGYRPDMKAGPITSAGCAPSPASPTRPSAGTIAKSSACRKRATPSTPTPRTAPPAASAPASTLTYGRLLTGWMFRELAPMGGRQQLRRRRLVNRALEAPPAEVHRRHGRDLRRACSTPHWMRELAIELAPDAWEDALAEQAQKGDLRAVTLPKDQPHRDALAADQHRAAPSTRTRPPVTRCATPAPPP